MSLTQKDLTNFVEGNLKYLKSKIKELPLHEQQQIELRKQLCSPCLKNGKCLHCGCKTPQMFFSPSKIDSEGKFAQFLNKEQWESLVNNIDDYYKIIKPMSDLSLLTFHDKLDDDFFEHFDYDEFDSPDEKGSGKKMQIEFLNRLTRTRHEANFPFIITSGYRTEAHNKKVGGTKGSAHTKGYAADVLVHNTAERFKLVMAAMHNGFNRIGIGQHYVHLDCDPSLPQNVMWDYYVK